MGTRTGNKFIPSYVLVFAVSAVAIPYLPILLRDLGYGPRWVGIFLAVFAGAGIAGPFIFGYWADRAGNYRSALIVSTVLPVFAMVPLVLLVHPVFTAVFLAIISFGLRSLSSLLDAVTTIQIGKSGDYGRIRVWGSISFILFALLMQWTPFLQPDNARNIALWMTLISAAILAPILTLPRGLLGSYPARRNGGNADADTEKSTPVVSAYAIGGFGIIFLITFAMSALYGYFPLYLTEVMGWDAVGLMFAVSSAAEVPLMFISVALIRRFGPMPLLAAAAAATSLRLMLWVLFPFRPVILASQLLHALCFGVFHPAAVRFVSGIFPPSKRGTGMSVFVAVGLGLPSLLGNMLGGVIVEGASEPAAGFRLLFALYAAAAGLGVLVYAAMRLLHVREGSVSDARTGKDRGPFP